LGKAISVKLDRLARIALKSDQISSVLFQSPFARQWRLR